MKFRSIAFVFMTVCAVAVLTSCEDKWEEHSELKDPSLGQNLYLKIKNQPGLSKFAELLEKSKLNEVLSSSKKFTVWAPSNDALANLNAEIINDEQKLRDFVAFHIAELPYNTGSAHDTLRLKTLNGKYLSFSDTGVEDAGFSTADLYTGNGVLHVINKPLIAKPNVFDVINSSSLKQKMYLASLNYEAIDSSIAEQTGVDPLTGKPVYKPGTGIVQKNQLFERVGDLRDESQEYTLFLVADDALEAERSKIKVYTKGQDDQATERLASLMVMKDLVFKGKYNLTNLPAQLVSEDGVVVPIDKSAIQESYQTSNGVVFVINKLNVPLSNKIRDVRQEGENPVGFSRTDKSGNIAYRLRRNPDTQQLFNDIYIFNHKIPLFHARYRVKDLYSIKYKVYWVAPNDVQTITFKQRFALSDPESEAFPETQVTLKNFNEVYVGEYTVGTFGDYNAFVVAANNGVDGQNSISLDYFRLEPQLP